MMRALKLLDFGIILSVLHVGLYAQNVGISVPNPLEKLHVAGDVRINSNSDVTTTIGSGALQVLNSTSTAGIHIDLNEIQTIGSALFLNNDNISGTHINNFVHFTTGQRIGVNITTPQGLIDVRGDGFWMVGTGGSFGAINPINDLIGFTDDDKWVLNVYATGTAPHGGIYVRMEGTTPKTPTTNPIPALEIDHYGTGPGLLITSYNSVDTAYAMRAQTDQALHTLFITNSANKTNTATIFARQDGSSCISGCKAIYGENISSGLGNGVGVYGYGGWVGVYGRAFNGANTNWAGRFLGNVYISGSLTATGAKSFFIDHPLDPENKYLLHYSVESNQVLNMYSGTVKVDNSGTAVVQLPDYFNAINRNVRYILTPIGAPAQVWIAEKVDNSGRFVIKSSVPNIEVSWLVIAERNDKWAQRYKPTDVVEKEPENKGRYLDPSLYEKPDYVRIGYEQERADYNYKPVLIKGGK